MAYYDQFTKKPRSPRDDWRDDEETLRPERDGEQSGSILRRRAVVKCQNNFAFAHAAQKLAHAAAAREEGNGGAADYHQAG